MGQIVGAGLVSHAPTIMFDEETRRKLNDGKEISLVPGLIRLRSEVLDRLAADSIIIIDSHWESTVEHIMAGQARRQGIFTSSELPRGMAQLPYDFPGDPELADAIARIGVEKGQPTHSSHDDYLPVYYATTNLVHYLRQDEKVVSVSVVQTGEPKDFLAMGEAIAAATAELDRRVVVLASGGMTHRFWPLSQIGDHEASDPSHIITPEARAADEERLRWMEAGELHRIIDTMDEYEEHSPEAGFGHFLMMLGAIGGRNCSARGEMFSDYENATGTGQVHVWFERPQSGWTG
ncbi:3,4-dihydroxyphenylacetate 2,3-dioxygenase [soil metagenome]